MFVRRVLDTFGNKAYLKPVDVPQLSIIQLSSSKSLRGTKYRNRLVTNFRSIVVALYWLVIYTTMNHEDDLTD